MPRVYVCQHLFLLFFNIVICVFLMLFVLMVSLENDTNCSYYLFRVVANAVAIFED